VVYRPLFDPIVVLLFVPYALIVYPQRTCVTRPNAFFYRCAAIKPQQDSQRKVKDDLLFLAAASCFSFSG